jgi:hypothetical protein
MRRVSTKFKLLESIPVDSTTLLESFCVTCAPSSSSNMRKLTYPITPAKLHLVQKMFPSLGLNLSVRWPFRSINIRGIWIQICAKLTEFEVSIYKYACHASGLQYFNGRCRGGPGALTFESFLGKARFYSAPGISVKVFGKSRVDITSVSPKMEANPMLSIYHN